MAPENENRAGILASISNNTKLLALIALIAEGLFVAALLKEDDGIDDTLLVIIAAVFLIITFLAIVYLERHNGNGNTMSIKKKDSGNDELLKLMDHLIKDALETVCRAVSLPSMPDQLGIRIFIFKKEKEDLICKFYWSQTRVIEMMRGEGLKFKINEKSYEKIAVVKSVLTGELQEMFIKPLSKDILESDLVKGNVDSNLKYVLAIPIFNEDKSVWGVVDFDASTDVAAETLQQPKSRETMLALSQLLSKIFLLKEDHLS